MDEHSELQNIEVTPAVNVEKTDIHADIKAAGKRYFLIKCIVIINSNFLYKFFLILFDCIRRRVKVSSL